MQNPNSKNKSTNFASMGILQAIKVVFENNIYNSSSGHSRPVSHPSLYRVVEVRTNMRRYAKTAYHTELCKLFVQVQVIDRCWSTAATHTARTVAHSQSDAI
jgi:hypothetical protein